MLEVAKAQLQEARASDSGRSAATIFRGDLLAQTVLALTSGSELAEHENPGEATLQVLVGRIQLMANDQVHEASAGDLLTIPPMRHSVVAVEDSAILLTVARR